MKSISPRRAAEFRGWQLRLLFGTRKERAERFAMLVQRHGYDVAVAVSAMSERSALRMDVRTHKGNEVTHDRR